MKIEMPRFKPKLTLFNIFYSTTFSLLSFLLFILLIITPIDAIYQTLKQPSRPPPFDKIIVIAGCYFLTLVSALATYGSRLYTVRTLMGDIPREYVPIKKKDLPKRVYARIRAGLGRSAVIAYESRPRAVRRGVEGESQIWGKINHNGWSRPDSEDFPDVEYATIIKELPGLIEKKVLSLGLQRRHYYHTEERERDEDEDEDEDEESTRRLLSHMPKMSLRAYISYLQKLGYVSPTVAEVFVRDYERVRFYSVDVNGVEEDEFRRLMKMFALLLREMDKLVIHSHQHNSDGIEYSGNTSSNSSGNVSAGPSNVGEWEWWKNYHNKNKNKNKLPPAGYDLHRTLTQTTDTSASFENDDSSQPREDIEMMEYPSPRHPTPIHSIIRQTPSFGTFG